MRTAFGIAAALVAWLAAANGPARADDIKIGEINSYSGLPAFTEPYRKGWQLALEEINAKGGADGKQLVVISKDDGGKPAEAVTAANQLVESDKVAMLMGTFFSNIGLAVSDFAQQKKVFFLAAEPLTDAITWAKGNRYTFRLRPSNSMQAAMLAEEAAKLPAKKWASVAPNYEYGQSAVAAFKKALSAKRPDIEWVSEQWPPQGKIDAGPVVQAVAAANPEAILNVTFGADLTNFVRQGNSPEERGVAPSVSSAWPTAATSSPSLINDAAESPRVVSPRIYIGYFTKLRSANSAVALSTLSSASCSASQFKSSAKPSSSVTFGS